eukprot:TRINITY_DN31177_c0_g1_i1.p2 TRINITY_DN31177_c0_g1~~TRINITY_DN31177_c0_g1_i1.p2  ORF type:complete len:240 (+),score=44.25 TRINITY_DN31177_c0_g1_i1:89-721(+)
MFMSAFAAAAALVAAGTDCRSVPVGDCARPPCPACAAAGCSTCPMEQRDPSVNFSTYATCFDPVADKCCNSTFRPWGVSCAASGGPCCTGDTGAKCCALGTDCYFARCPAGPSNPLCCAKANLCGDGGGYCLGCCDPGSSSCCGNVMDPAGRYRARCCPAGTTCCANMLPGPGAGPAFVNLCCGGDTPRCFTNATNHTSCVAEDDPRLSL